MNAGKPQSAWRLLVDAVTLYRRYPLLFLILAAGVIVPYELILLAASGAGPFEDDAVSGTVGLLLSLGDLVIVTPLVSALHVHAVADARAGQVPKLGPVTRRGLQALPVAAAASVMSGIGIGIGFVALVIPGIYLTLRWMVVAQAAAIERDGWLPALGRSHQLVRDHYGHVVVFALVVGVISTAPLFLLGLVFDGTSAVSFLVAVVVQILSISFAALTTALLYFDLRTRRELALVAVQGAGGGEPPREASAADHDLDPRLYTDETRPAGWYINPAAPHRMRYWARGERPGWALKATRTPRKARRAWDARAASEDSPNAS